MDDRMAAVWGWIRRPRSWWLQGPLWLLAAAIALGVWPLLLALHLIGRSDAGPVVSRLAPLALAVLWVPYVFALGSSANQSTEAEQGAEVATSRATVEGTQAILGADLAAAPTTHALDSGVSITTGPAAVAPTSATAATGDGTTASTTASEISLPMALVVSVTDGDTIVVALDEVDEPLRLIGINSPEGGECLADEATARLTELINGEIVGLERDVSERDQFERLLRYVYLDGLFVNEVLVEEGLAIARRYDPDTAHAEILEAAELRAQDAGVGMWAADACGEPTSSDLAIGSIRFDADGDDNFNLNDEWIEIDNNGTTAADMSGWVLKDESASHRFNFPAGFTIAAGATVRIHTGCGTDAATALYWCNTGSAVWNNSGDTAFLLDPLGNIVDTKSY